MRIAWLDTQPNPWSTELSWDYLKENGLTVIRCQSVPEARSAVESGARVLILSNEIPDALEYLTELRATSTVATILISSTWSKQDFRAHSQSPGAAHRYARLPMSANGFVDVLCGLVKLTRDELKASEATTPEQSLVDSLLGRATSRDYEAEQSKPIRTVRAEPGPASDSESGTLRKYLQMREEELALLQGRFQEMQVDYERLQGELVAKDKELRLQGHKLEEAERKSRTAEEKTFSLEKQLVLEKENADLELKSEQEKQRELDRELTETKDRYESLKARVRKDLRKIRVRERDLESKLELLRTDSERMVEARDAKVLELQRKIDALEFDLDQIQDSRHKALSQAERYLAKLARVSRTLQLAVSMIDDNGKDAAVAVAGDHEPMLGGAIADFESLADDDVEKSLSASTVASAPVTAPASRESSLQQENDEKIDADALISLHTTATAAVASSASLGQQSSIASDLQSLANDGDATRVVSRPALEESEGQEKSDAASKLNATG